YCNHLGALRAGALPSILLAAIISDAHRHVIDSEWVAAIFDAAIFVMHIAAAAFFNTTTCERQTRRFRSQVAGVDMLSDQLARRARGHDGYSVKSSRVTRTPNKFLLKFSQRPLMAVFGKTSV
ncbi:MAG: hypothetical protein ABW049_12940, partial [Spongiibacteraceae bacterium]